MTVSATQAGFQRNMLADKIQEIYLSLILLGEFEVPFLSLAVLLNFCITLNEKHLRSSEDLRTGKVPIHPLASLSCENLNRYSLNMIKLKLNMSKNSYQYFFIISNCIELVSFLYTCVLNYNGTALS